MEDWSSVPAFGERIASGKCVIRPGAYGLLEKNFQQLAVVRVENRLYLPGGGIDAGESLGETLIREFHEECGLSIRPGKWTTHAVEFVNSRSEMKYYEKRSTFVEVAIDGPAQEPSETDHELIWWDADSVAEILSHGSRRWAVEQWIKRQRN